MFPIEKLNISEETQASLIRGASILLEPFGIGANILSDKLTYYRLECLVNTMNKVKKLCEENGINATSVSNKFLARFVEEASFEDELELQDMWANLFVSELADKEDNISYINILKELNLYSAKLLDGIYEEVKDKGFDFYETVIEDNLDGSFWGSETIDLDNLKKKKNTFLISYSSSGSKNEYSKNNMNALVHLEKLGLIKIKSEKGEANNFGLNPFAIYASITPFGYNFVTACKTLNTNEE